MTLNEIKDKYLEYENNRLAEDNYITHKSALKKYILPLVGNKDVKDIDGKDIIFLLEYRMSNKHTVLSVRTYYYIIYDVFKYLENNHYINDNLLNKHVYYSRKTGKINYDYE